MQQKHHSHKMLTSSLHSILVSAAIISITSCAVGPDYKRPAVTVPTKFKEAKTSNKEWKIATPCDEADRGEWWKIFHDKQLNTLEKQLAMSNQSILSAEANYRQSRAIVDEARAGFYPALSGTATFTRQKGAGSATIINSPNSSSTTSSSSSTGISANSSSQINNTHSIIFDTTWAPDIWGQVRRTVEADTGAAQASQALLANTRLASQGSLATYYFELRALDTDQVILDATARDDQKILKLTKYQYQSGVASRADILQAQSQFDTAKAAAINNGINRALYEHAIAVLIGKPPADFAIASNPLRSPPPHIPVSLPSSLLERRPDVAQAERLMVQANAEIGVALSAYYPTLNLTANGSFVGKGLSHWISMPQLGWAYGPQLAEILYDGGLRAATVKAARAGYDSTVASYRQVVLTAFQNVEDNLASLRILTKEAAVQNDAARTAKKALVFITNEYKAGTVPYSSVLTAQITAAAAEKTAADITGLRMTAAVGLVMALGGGWDASQLSA